jgi:hypothetical protein
MPWADPSGTVHGAGEFVDVDVVTLAELEEQGVVENAGEEQEFEGTEFVGPGESEGTEFVGPGESADDGGFVGPGEEAQDTADGANE